MRNNVVIQAAFFYVTVTHLCAGDLKEVTAIGPSSGEDSIVQASNYSKNVSHCSFPKSWNVLLSNAIIIPYEKCTSFSVLRCYCLTSDTCANGSCSLVIGQCPYSCIDIINAKPRTVYNHIRFPMKNGLCAPFNREGALCGKCMKGYGVPAYSFSFKCVHCGNESLWTTIPRYVLVAYGPLTLFLAMIVVFTVSVNSAPLRGWILVCQILSSNLIMRTLIVAEELKPDIGISPYIQIFGSVYGVWNLDFFRSVYKSLCLHPRLTTLQVMSLDYIIAAYPLVLIFVMYAMVELYSRNFRPMVLLGRLLHHCCVRFRHRLDIRTSLVDAFGTFFSLSFVKFLSTTVDMLASTKVWESNSNTTAPRLYFQGTTKPVSIEHILYFILALIGAVLGTIMPLLLILAYSFPRAQILLNIFPRSLQQLMYPFMDNVMACYKDGTNGTRNRRYFAIVYHFALLLLASCFLIAKNTVVLGWTAFVCILIGMLVAVVQPYKSKIYNTVDTILILSVGLCFAGAVSSFISYVEAPFQKKESIAMLLAPFSVPLIYCIGYGGLKIFFKIRHLVVNAHNRISNRHIIHEEQLISPSDI